MALMLFNPIEPAMSEVARVMSAKGMFRAIVPSSWSEVPPHTKEFNSLVTSSAKSVFPSYPYIGIGNGRLKSVQSINALVQETMGMGFEVRLDDDLFHFRSDVDEAMQFVSHLYWFDLLPLEHRSRIAESFVSHFESLLDDQGKTIVTRPFCRITVMKK